MGMKLVDLLVSVLLVLLLDSGLLPCFRRRRLIFLGSSLGDGGGSCLPIVAPRSHRGREGVVIDGAVGFGSRGRRRRAGEVV